MQTFRNLLKTDEAPLNTEDIDVIFCRIPDLHESHDLFVSELQPLVDNWSDEQQIAEPIKVLVSMLIIRDGQIAPYTSNFVTILTIVSDV